MIEFQELRESPTFDVSDFVPPDALNKIGELTFPEEDQVLEVECFRIEAVKCVYSLTRHRIHGHVHYSSVLFLLFAECFWVLALELEERESVGAREGAVARTFLEQTSSSELPQEEFDPYDRNWDGILPIEDDPLARVRLLALELQSSVRLSERVQSLDPFSPEEP